MLDITSVISRIPFRMALAGGWIDQPFVSQWNPDPPGSMVVVSVQPDFRFMDRSGFATGTREVAIQLWNGALPEGDPAQLVRDLYEAENSEKPDPSGSQDMIGMIYPGVSRLDYEGGIFPAQIVSDSSEETARWIEQSIQLVAVNQRPEGYHPLGVKNLSPEWIARLGRTGKDCFDAIQSRDIRALGASMNDCMRCWEAILPHTVEHPSISIDLKALLCWYQHRYPGAMYSGCGGGYLYIAAEEPVPGSSCIRVRR